MNYRLSWQLDQVQYGVQLMDMDDLEPKKQPQPKKNLEVMSIEALNEYIEELRTEIARVERAITLKESAKNAAEAVFKK